MTTAYDPTQDLHINDAVGTDSIGRNSLVIVNSDTVDTTPYPRDIVVTTTGNFTVLPLYAPDDGAHLIPFVGLGSGYVFPFRIRRIQATGTTGSAASVRIT